MVMKKYAASYESIISIEGLFAAWRSFVKGKHRHGDIALFEMRLMDNLLALHRDLKNKTYTHGPYRAFVVQDPKRRDIHKATVRDRVLHHLLYRTLYPYFDQHFIHDSYSCRLGKGTHRALDRFRAFGRKVSRNHTRTCWILKGDVKKFFASIDHATMQTILRHHIEDQNILALLARVINSFEAPGHPGVGLPLGNLTSQLLVNVYMNEFDQYAKHSLGAQHYIRYGDDFVFFHGDKNHLEKLLPLIRTFLSETLQLSLHPDKVFLQTLASGVDFLGWVHFPNHRVLRTTTKKRMFRRIAERPSEQTIQSYLGLLSHGNAHQLAEKVRFASSTPQ
jgi:retron-type reverse transcriptase